MSASSAANIRSLPLHEKHAGLGARFGAFGEWQVPLYYTSILEEHKAVRTRAGLFDISHMGEFFFSGARAAEFLNELLPRNILDQKNGRALYMPLLRDNGTTVDDIIVYRFSEDRFLVIVNAGNIAKDFEWIHPRVPKDVEFVDRSEEFGLLALQGPESEKIAGQTFGGEAIAGLTYYSFRPFRSGLIAATGYTGERGYEIMIKKNELPSIWDSSVAKGAQAVGFGARDTLRLEAAMPLYGHDLNDETTPLEAGLDWAIDWNKKSFVGRGPLIKQKETGPQKKLIGFEMIDRGIPRQDYEILKSGKKIGKVTSGSFAPTLEKNIGMGYVEAAEAREGNEIEILVRDKNLKAKSVGLPFYARPKTKD